MGEEGRMSELLGRVLERQDIHTEQLKAIVGKVDCLDRKVTQHRTGWQIFVWVGGAAIAIFAAFNGFLRS